MPTVKIGPSFFKKELLEYSNWVTGYVREALQNCIDAKGSTKAEFTIIDQLDGTVKIIFSNNGATMDENTIINKLLALGESGKTNDNSNVGGFGKAKTLLYFSHNSYTIRSGNNLIIGTGGDYTLTNEKEFYNGTISEVIIPNCSGKDFYKAISEFTNLCQWSNGTVEINYNGSIELANCSLRKGSFRKDLSFGKLYTNKSFRNKLIFRINGIPMFQKWVNFEGCVIVESTKNSLEVMTSNRDNLKWNYQEEIEAVIDAFTTNRSSILRDKPVIEVFGDTYIEAGVEVEMKIDVEESPNIDTPEQNHQNIFNSQLQVQDHNVGSIYINKENCEQKNLKQISFNDATIIVQKTATTDLTTPEQTTKSYQNKRQVRFMIFNDSGMKLPEYAKPITMGAHFKKLSEIWTKILVKLHELHGIKAIFGIGFTIGSAEAQYISHQEMKYYLINPFNIINASNTKCLKKKFNFITNKEKIIMLAVHEYTHSFVESHNETYAIMLTEIAELAMKNIQELKRCF